MKFMERRRRIFDGVLSRIVVQLLAQGSLVYVGWLSLKQSSWVPIIGWAIVPLIVEAVIFYDLIYGWPEESSKTPSSSK